MGEKVMASPPLPPGFVLNAPPPLPQGFVLDSGISTSPVIQEPEIDGADYARGLNQTFIKGATSGFSDEVVGAGRAALDMATRDQNAEGNQNWEETYRVFRDDERESQKRFADENKKTAIAAEIVGAFGSPLGKAKLAAGGGKVAQTAANIGRGAAEGAIYGAGEAEELGDVASGAAEGAKWGAGGQAVVSGAGGTLGRALSNKRVKEALYTTTKDGQPVFKPLNLADPEGKLGKLYRDVVAVAYGGDKVGKQESAYLQKSLSRALQDSTTETAQQQAERLIPIEIGTKNALRDASQAITDEKMLAKAAEESALGRTKAALTATSNAKQAANAADTALAIQNQQASVAGDVAKLRADAAMRADAGGVLVAEDLVDPQKAANKLKQWWNKEAFSVVKNKPDFQIDSTIKNNLDEMMRDDAAFKAAVEKNLGPINNLPDTLDGDTLMEIRNRYARGANKGKGLDRYAQRQVANELDDLIISQLDDDGKKVFADQKEKYKTYLTVRDATKKAYAESGGNYSAKQLRSAAAKYGDAATGSVPVDDISTAVVMKETGLPSAISALKDVGKVAGTAEKSALSSARSAAEQKTAHKVKRIAQRERAAKRFVERESRGVTAENPSVGNKVVATAALGAPVAAVLGNAAALPLGYGVAKGLSTEAAQTFLAGQQKWQEELARALQDGATDKYGRSINRAFVGQSTGE